MNFYEFWQKLDETQLTPAEMQVAQMKAQGRPQQEIDAYVQQYLQGQDQARMQAQAGRDQQMQQQVQAGQQALNQQQTQNQQVVQQVQALQQQGRHEEAKKLMAQETQKQTMMYIQNQRSVDPNFLIINGQDFGEKYAAAFSSGDNATANQIMNQEIQRKTQALSNQMQMTTQQQPIAQ